MLLIALFLGLLANVICIEVLPYTQWANKSVMFIVAHPDDIECCAGGLISYLTQQNTTVYYVIVTNGDKGCSNPICEDWTMDQIAAARRIEQLNAAAVFNIPPSNVIMLNFQDAMVTSYLDIEMRPPLIREIRKLKPDVVMTWFLYPDLTLLPSKGWDDIGYHPDHQAVGRYTLDAKFDSGIARLWPELGPVWAPSDFYMFGFSSATHYVDITNSIDMKIKAYLEHKTQYSDAAVMADDIKLWANMTAENLGLSVFTDVEGYTKFA